GRDHPGPAAGDAAERPGRRPDHRRPGRHLRPWREHGRPARAQGGADRRAGREGAAGARAGRARAGRGAGGTGALMTSRLFILDVPENTGVVGVARDLPGVKVGKAGPYFVIESAAPISIDRRATGMRHAVWYSCVAGLNGWRIAQWDKDALRTGSRGPTPPPGWGRARTPRD